MKRLDSKYSEVDQYLAYVNDTTGEVKLSETVKRKVERWEFANNLIVQHGVCRTSINLMKEKFKIDQATVYRDFDSAMQVFGSIHRNQKEYLRHVHLQKSFALLSAAEKVGDFAAWKAALSELRRNAGFEKADPDLPDFSKIQPPRILVGFFPQLLNVPLPDDWEAQVKELVKAKRKKNLNVEDAQIVEDDDQ